MKKDLFFLTIGLIIGLIIIRIFANSSFLNDFINKNKKTYKYYELSSYVESIDNNGSLQNKSEKMFKGIRHEKKDEIPSHWGNSNSVEEGKSGNHPVLREKGKNANPMFISLKEEKQYMEDKGIAEVSEDIATKKSQAPEFSYSETSTVANEKSADSFKGEEANRSADSTKPAFSNYYVQIGAWKNPDLADKMFNKVSEKYHETHMIVENNLHKVRILGVRTKEEGMDISQDIEKKFNISPIVVRNPQ